MQAREHMEKLAAAISPELLEKLRREAVKYLPEHMREGAVNRHLDSTVGRYLREGRYPGHFNEESGIQANGPAHQFLQDYRRRWAAAAGRAARS